MCIAHQCLRLIGDDAAVWHLRRVTLARLGHEAFIGRRRLPASCRLSHPAIRRQASSGLQSARGQFLPTLDGY